jgi:nitroreductase
MDERLAFLFRRRSIRAYTAEPVSEADIQSLLEAGMAAPSAANRKPWHLVAVTDRALLDQISQTPAYSRTIGHAPLAIVVCGDPAISDWWVQDCTAATENILIAVSGLGLGAVWHGCLNREERERPVRDALGIPDEIGMAAVLAIGHPAEEKEARTQYDSERDHRNGW